MSVIPFDTLFGGTAMHLMDEVAFITATRFSRLRMVTVSSDKIDFKKPIPHGTIIELIGQVTRVGNTSLQVSVDIFIEQIQVPGGRWAVSRNFALVAIDEDTQPVPILKMTSICDARLCGHEPRFLRTRSAPCNTAGLLTVAR